MAFDPGYVAVEKAKYPLQKLFNWLESRLEGGGDANSDPILAEYAMPTFDVVWSQFLQLAERLRVAAAETTTAQRFGNRWENASGTVISADIWKHRSRFAQD
eukprot:4195643-Prymnesium_polylepis.1